MSKKQTLETLAFKALENGEATTELLKGYEPGFELNWSKYDWYFLYDGLPNKYHTKSKYKPALLAAIWARTVARGRIEAEVEFLAQIISDETGRTLDQSLQLVEDIRYDKEEQQVENCARAVGKLFTKKKGWEKLDKVIQAENALDELIYAIKTEALKNYNNYNNI
jgi:hypothetical protein